MVVETFRTCGSRAGDCRRSCSEAEQSSAGAVIPLSEWRASLAASNKTAVAVQSEIHHPWEAEEEEQAQEKNVTIWWCNK